MVVEELEKILAKYHAKTAKQHSVIFYGGVGLVAMVNSKTYIDKYLSIKKEKSGINELITAIAQSLDEKALHGWYLTISANKQAVDSIKSNTSLPARIIGCISKASDYVFNHLGNARKSIRESMCTENYIVFIS